MSDKKAVIKNVDMSDEMQDEALNVSIQALDKYNIEKDIAAYIKKEFDKKYNPTWHCIVGRNFGSYVTHETRHFIYFYLGQVAILLFKSGWRSSLVSHLSLSLSLFLSLTFSYFLSLSLSSLPFFLEVWLAVQELDLFWTILLSRLWALLSSVIMEGEVRKIKFN